MRKLILAIAIALFSTANLAAQPAFESEVVDQKKDDKRKNPPGPPVVNPKQPKEKDKPPPPKGKKQGEV